MRVVLDAAAVRRCVDEAGIGFIFAPAFHPAMRHAAGGPARARHPHRVQRARPARQPGAGAPPGARRRRAPRRWRRWPGCCSSSATSTRWCSPAPAASTSSASTASRAATRSARPGSATSRSTRRRSGMPVAGHAALAGGDAATNARIIRGVLDGGLGLAARRGGAERGRRAGRRATSRPTSARASPAASRRSTPARPARRCARSCRCHRRPRDVRAVAAAAQRRLAGSTRCGRCRGRRRRARRALRRVSPCGPVPRIIATELSAGPLRELRANLAAWRLSERVEVRCGPGLAPLAPAEVDVAVIAGVGATTMLGHRRRRSRSRRALAGPAVHAARRPGAVLARRPRLAGAGHRRVGAARTVLHGSPRGGGGVSRGGDLLRLQEVDTRLH